jgi:hypothetical protein
VALMVAFGKSLSKPTPSKPTPKLNIKF